jgi:hypothetical protein
VHPVEVPDQLGGDRERMARRPHQSERPVGELVEPIENQRDRRVLLLLYHYFDLYALTLFKINSRRRGRRRENPRTVIGLSTGHIEDFLGTVRILSCARPLDRLVLGRLRALHVELPVLLLEVADHAVLVEVMPAHGGGERTRLTAPARRVLDPSVGAFAEIAAGACFERLGPEQHETADHDHGHDFKLCDHAIDELRAAQARLDLDETRGRHVPPALYASSVLPMSSVIPLR